MTLLTVKAIEDLVAEVAACAGDEEIAHGKEDALLFTVLKAIASGDHEGTPAELAAAAVRVSSIDFNRWYA